MLVRYGSLFRIENCLTIDHFNIFEIDAFDVLDKGYVPYASPVHRHVYSVELQVEGPLNENGFVVGHQFAVDDHGGFGDVLKVWNKSLVYPSSDKVKLEKDEYGREFLRLTGEIRPADENNVAYLAKNSSARRWTPFDGSFIYDPLAPDYYPDVDKCEVCKNFKKLNKRGQSCSSEEMAREILENFIHSCFSCMPEKYAFAEYGFILKLFEELSCDVKTGRDRCLGASCEIRGPFHEIMCSIEKNFR